MCGFEVGAEAGHRIFDLEGLTGEDIEVDVIRLFNEVGRDVRCLDQLDEGIALLVSISEHHNTRRPEGHHVDLLDKIFGERSDRGLGSESGGITVAGIHNQMVAPFTLFLCSAFRSCTLSSRGPTHPPLFMRER